MEEMLEFQPHLGKILMKGARVLIVSASALGTLRRDLISVLGQDRARGFLLRYGFECGYNDAISVRQQNPDCSDQFWSEQGPLLHTLEGVVRVKVETMEFDRRRGHYFVQGTWENSYEAEEHARLIGHSEVPVCWTLVGYAGGYTTAVVGRRVLFRELTCVARGDSACRFVGKTVDAWGPEAEAELAFYSESKIAEELEAAHRRIQQQHRLLQQIMTMHEQLSRLVLEGRDRQALVETVGQMLGAPVAVEDRHLRPLAIWVPPGEAAPPRDYLLGPRLADSPALREKLRALEREKRALEFGPADHAALQARLVAPIILGSGVMGYLSVIRQPGGDGEMVRMFIERAAAVMGLEMLKERTALETEHRLKGEFIDELLSASAPLEAVRNRARFLGYDLDRPHRFLILRMDRPLPAANREMLRLRDELFELVRSAISPWARSALAVERGEGILLLCHTGPDGLKPRQLAQGIQQQVREALRGVTVSIGISRESAALEHLRGAFEECRAALELQGNLGRRGEVVSVEEMGAFELLYAGLGQDPLRAYAQRTLQVILEYDRQHGAQLLPTLYWYLTHECNLRETARAMNISLSGLKYRLQRLREVGHLDLDNPERRFDLQLALKVLMAGGAIKLAPA